MAKGLDLAVVAEGVETEDQLSFVTSQGCDSAQGYLLGMPMPEDAYVDLLRNLPARTEPPRLSLARKPRSRTIDERAARSKEDRD
jgi:predicted signal transduction protein with EAL and GGDEF domain